jgi:hypothetical protein
MAKAQTSTPSDAIEIQITRYLSNRGKLRRRPPMSRSQPDEQDYLSLFRIYGDDLGSLYREPDDDRYALLFEQVVRLLVKPSPFNRSLPEPFRVSARRYHDGDPATVKHLSHPANRHFMLCDLHDLISLRSRIARNRRKDRP